MSTTDHAYLTYLGLSQRLAASRIPVDPSLSPPLSAERQAEEQSVKRDHFPQAPSTAFNEEYAAVSLPGRWLLDPM